MRPNDDNTVFSNMNQANNFDTQYDPTTPYQEPQNVEAAPQEAKKNGSNAAVKIGAGIIGGAAVGAGVMYAGEALAGSDGSLGDTLQESTHDAMQMANVNDEMSFADAFAAARAQVGAGGVFTWRGGVYGTYTQDEWNSMTPEQRAAFTDEAMGQYGGGVAQSASPTTNTVHEVHEVHDVHHGPHPHPAQPHPAQPQGNAPHAEPAHGPAANHTPQGGAETAQQSGSNTAEYEPVSNEQPSTSINGESDGSVHIIGSRTVEMEGQMVDVYDAEVDGHYGMLVDVDRDGSIDMYGVDWNDNGTFDENEVEVINQSDVDNNDAGYTNAQVDENEIYVATDDSDNALAQVVETEDPVSFDDPEDGGYISDNGDVGSTDGEIYDDPVSFDDPEVYVADNTASDGMDDFINDANVDILA